MPSMFDWSRANVTACCSIRSAPRFENGCLRAVQLAAGHLQTFLHQATVASGFWITSSWSVVSWFINGKLLMFQGVARWSRRHGVPPIQRSVNQIVPSSTPFPFSTLLPTFFLSPFMRKWLYYERVLGLIAVRFPLSIRLEQYPASVEF